MRSEYKFTERCWIYWKTTGYPQILQNKIRFLRQHIA